jgi:hypothetical protein
MVPVSQALNEFDNGLAMFRCVSRKVLTATARGVYVSAPEGRGQLGAGP